MVNDQGHSACRTRIFKKGVLTGEDATFIGHYMRMLELPAFSQVQSNRKLPDPPLHTAVRYESPRSRCPPPPPGHRRGQGK